MLESMTHIHQATKSWKPYVQDAFSDPGLFDLRKGDARRLWTKLWASMLGSEKDKLLELFGASIAMSIPGA